MGTNSTVIQGVSVGEHTIIGAGAVAVRDLPARCTAVGVPARVIKNQK
jgi:acetyltransferase-like isoleucine patch superfamily enzyme